MCILLSIIRAILKEYALYFILFQIKYIIEHVFSKTFFAAMGPILPQLSVYGKKLGISSVVMGTITGILPFAFLLAKPAFGLLVDVYRKYRKAIFMFLILIMTLSYAAMNFIPPRTLLTLHLQNLSAPPDPCNVTVSSY